MTTVLEIESKFDVGPMTALPDLSDLPSVARVDAPVEQQLVATYFDTSQLDLVDAGVTLRRRTGDTAAGWHLKIPSGSARYELREPLGYPSDIPRRFTETVLGLTHGKPLLEVATLRTHRSITRLRDRTGAVVAEVCDDVVDADLTPGRSATRWREWELELARPDHDLAQAGAHLLTAAGATSSDVPNKLFRALAISPHDDVADLGPNSTVAEALTPYLRSQAARLRQLDPLVRADLPDAVHQMRVSARRLRAVLLGYDREFAPGSTARVRKDLGWLGSELGRARDLEVLRDRIKTAAGEDRAALGAVDARLAEAHRQAHLDAVAVMTSPRYFGLLDALTRLVAAPPWDHAACQRATAEFEKRLRHLWRVMDKAVADLDGPTGSERAVRLHEVRRMAKRLRYCAEAAQPVLGVRARDLARVMSDVQDLLGRHHDATLAVRLIEGIDDPDAVAVAGLTSRRLEAEAHDDDRAAVRTLSKVRSRHPFRWLR